MNLRYNPVAAIAIIAATFFSATLMAANSQSSVEPAEQTRWQQRAQQKQEIIEDVTWLTHEPLEFLLRRGDHYDDEPEQYQRMCRPENIKRMADAGLRWGCIFFYKGFGLEYERHNMEQAKQVADVMHQLDMKVALYMAGTMFTETLYREVPEARDWEQRDQDNHWVPYGIQTYRHYACPNSQGYREYIKRVLKIAVEDLRADEIIFDNVMLQDEPKSCRCPRCMEAFRNFLQERYPTKDAVKRRFGLPDVDCIRVNEWSSPEQPKVFSALNDPVLQEWVRFRCESHANNYNELSDYIKSLNPNVAVHLNIKGLYSFNRYWTNAVYHPLFANHVDIMTFDTGGYDAGINPKTGALVSQIRSYKMARRLGIRCSEILRNDLLAAVHMAFSYQNPVGGQVGMPFGSGAHRFNTPVMEFFREYNDRYYTGVDNVADVAVLRNWPSMAYSINAAYFPATLMEQVLIQYKIPFDLLFEEQLDRIDRYDAVILAGQECVSDEQVELLLQYVRNGGSLILACNTGEYNQWRERRRTNPLPPARAEGKGRIIYIPEIIPADSLDSGVSGTGLARNRIMSTAEWVLPENHRQISQTIVDALPKGLSITTEAPLTTVMELFNRPATRESIVHFVNFDRQNKLEPFRVTMRKQFPGRVRSVSCFSPDADDPVALDFRESDESVIFTVPSTRLYSMIVVAHE